MKKDWPNCSEGDVEFLMSVAPVGALGTVKSSCVISVADDPVEAWPLLSRLGNRVDSKLITFLIWCPLN